MPTPPDLEAIAAEAACQGADVIRAQREQLGSIGTKSSPTDPVTALDLAVERSCASISRERTPGASFLGEEEGATGRRLVAGLDPRPHRRHREPDLRRAASSPSRWRPPSTARWWPGPSSMSGATRSSARRSVPGPGSTGRPISPSDRGGAGPGPGGHGLRLLGRGAGPREVEAFGRVLPAAVTSAASGPRRCTSAGWPAVASMPTTSATCKRWDYAAGALIAAEVRRPRRAALGAERPPHGGGQPARLRRCYCFAAGLTGRQSIRRSQGPAARQRSQMLTRSAFWTGSDMRATARMASHSRRLPRRSGLASRRTAR